MRHNKRGRPEGRPTCEKCVRLAAQTEAAQERVVPINIGVAQVAQLASALADEHEQATTGVEVVAVLAQVEMD